MSRRHKIKTVYVPYISKEKEHEIMTAIDNLTAAVKAAEARLDGVIPTVNALRDTAAQLQTQLAALSATQNVDPELQALADDLTGHVAAFDEALNPTTTTPVPTTTEEPTTVAPEQQG